MGQSLSKRSGRSQISGTATGSKPKLILYHALAQAFQGGNNKRPGLPIELVAYILRLADCTIVSRRLSMTIEEGHKVTASHNGVVTRVLWFVTPPLHARDRGKIAKMQLLTVSRDQGWCTNPEQGSWSWFEVAILIPDEETNEKESKIYKVKKGPDGKELVWTSHCNPIASGDLAIRNGRTFESEHDIFRQVGEGDRFGVQICAQYGGWSNEVKEGILRIEQWFDPTLSFPNPEYL